MSHRFKLSPTDAAMVKYRLSRGESLRVLASAYGISVGAIQSIKRDESYHYIGVADSIRDVATMANALPRRRGGGRS